MITRHLFWKLWLASRHRHDSIYFSLCCSSFGNASSYEWAYNSIQMRMHPLSRKEERFFHRTTAETSCHLRCLQRSTLENFFFTFFPNFELVSVLEGRTSCNHICSTRKSETVRYYYEFVLNRTRPLVNIFNFLVVHCSSAVNPRIQRIWELKVFFKELGSGLYTQHKSHN